MRTWSGLSAASRKAAGMTRGTSDATRPGQFSVISGLAGAAGVCAGAERSVGSNMRDASAASAKPRRRTRTAISALLLQVAPAHDSKILAEKSPEQHARQPTIIPKPFRQEH